VDSAAPERLTRRARSAVQISAREEPDQMAAYRRIHVSEDGEVSVVQFLDGEIRGEATIDQLGQELTQLVEQDHRRQILLNFGNVDFLSSAALVKLITLHKLLKSCGGRMKLCSVRPEFYEVFAITKLNSLFDIQDNQADALAAFSSVE
jgi:anti-sigma B factor antagonist